MSISSARDPARDLLIGRRAEMMKAVEGALEARPQGALDLGAEGEGVQLEAFPIVVLDCRGEERHDGGVVEFSSEIAKPDLSALDATFGARRMKIARRIFRGESLGEWALRLRRRRHDAKVAVSACGFAGGVEKNALELLDAVPVANAALDVVETAVSGACCRARRLSRKRRSPRQRLANESAFARLSQPPSNCAD